MAASRWLFLSIQPTWTAVVERASRAEWLLIFYVVIKLRHGLAVICNAGLVVIQRAKAFPLWSVDPDVFSGRGVAVKGGVTTSADLTFRYL